MSLANISIVGNLAKPPEQNYFASGSVKTTLVVAVNGPNRANKGNNMADFYKVEIWGKLAELAGEYLAKGNQVAVSGRLVFNRWTDRQGKERMTPVIEASQLALPPKPKVPGASDETVNNETINGHSTNAISGELEFLEAADSCGGDGDEEPGVHENLKLAPQLNSNTKSILVTA